MPQHPPPICGMLSPFERAMAKRKAQLTGELMERSGWWMLRYSVDTPEIDPKTNRPKRERIIVPLARSTGPEAKTKSQMNRERVTYMARIDQFAVRPSSTRTLQEFVEQRFYPDRDPGLKPAGRKFYRSILGKHVLPILGAFALREIIPARIQALITLKLQAGLGVQSCAHIRNCLSAVLRHARAMQWFVGDLPTAAVRLPRMKRKPRRAMTWEQVCSLANALPEPVSTLVVFLTVTGLRIGEAMGLRWKWLNLTPQAQIVDGELVPPLSVAVRENWVLGGYQTLKTSASMRNVPLPAWIVPRLLKLQFHSKRGPEQPVFASQNVKATGKPIDQHNIAKRLLKPAAAALGMGTPAEPATATARAKPAKSWVSWHVFRHTNATLADQAGFSVTERQRILGHKTEAITMHYGGVNLDSTRPRMNAMVNPKLLQYPKRKAALPAVAAKARPSASTA